MNQSNHPNGNHKISQTDRQLINQPAQQPVVHLTPVLRDLIAGTSSGIASILVCHPLDTIRVRMQTTNTARFQSISQLIKQTVHHEGVRALYKGMSAPIAAQGLQKCTMFVAHGQAKRSFEPFFKRSFNQSHNLSINQTGLPPLQLEACCGAIAGASNALVATPIELVRNRLQTQYHSLKKPTINPSNNQTISPSPSQPQYRGPIDCARQVFRVSGFRGLWSGFTPMLARDAPGVAAWYTAFEATRRLLTRDQPKDQPTPKWKLLLSGATGGVGFWVCAFPQDTIKSIMQTQSISQSINQVLNATNQSINQSMFSTARQLIASDGVTRLWRGFPIALMRGVPGAAITFTTYTTVMEHLKKY